jgi:hypothetical protein
MAKSPWRSLLAGALGSITVALLWTGLAALNPTTNYHLSPLIAVLAAPAVARIAQSGRLPAPVAAITVVTGVAVTAITAGIVNAAGWALGPTFTSYLTPSGELLGAIVIGAVFGAIVSFAPWGVREDSQDASTSEATIRSSSSTDH